MKPRLNYYSTLLLKEAIGAGITDSRELAALMGNAAVETGHFTRMHESFAYRSASRLIAVVSSADERFSLAEIESAIASKDPTRIATVMYERRADLGNSESGDGWRFHGRGYLQYTGRYNYARYGEKFGVDLVGFPDLAAEPRLAATLAIAYWRDKVPQHLRQDVEAAARIINGGENGMDARVRAAEKWAGMLSPDLIDAIRNRTVAPEQFLPQERERINALPPAFEDRNPIFMRGGFSVSGLSETSQSLLAQCASHVGDLDRKLGRRFDETSERFAASLACLAHASGLSRVDHVVLSSANEHVAEGENVFVVQGRLDDPAHLKAHMKTHAAIDAPTSQSLQRLAMQDPPAPDHLTLVNGASSIDVAPRAIRI